MVIVVTGFLRAMYIFYDRLYFLSILFYANSERNRSGVFGQRRRVAKLDFVQIFRKALAVGQAMPTFVRVINSYL